MGDPTKPVKGDPPPTARPVAARVPFARPVTLVPGQPARASADELLLPTSTAGQAWIDLAALVAFLMLFETWAGAVLALVVEAPMGPDAPPVDWADPRFGRELLLPSLALRAGAAMFFIAAILRYRRQPIRSVGLSRTRLTADSLIGIGATAIVYGLILVTSVLLWFFWPDFLEQLQENARRIMVKVPKQHPLGFALVAVVISLYEELLFRGFLMTRLRRATGSWVFAVLASTAVFTALHAGDQTIIALVWITTLSLVFSVTTVWRRSIVPAIVGHALFDLSQFLLLYVQAGDQWV